MKCGVRGGASDFQVLLMIFVKAVAGELSELLSVSWPATTGRWEGKDAGVSASLGDSTGSSL